MPRKYIRTTDTGDRLDCPHPQSYLRFASPIEEIFNGLFHPAVVADRMDLLAGWEPPAELVQWYRNAAISEWSRRLAVSELSKLSAPLNAEQHANMIELLVKSHDRTAKARGEIALSAAIWVDAWQSGQYVAQRGTGPTLVGAAWINLPVDIAASKANREIALRFAAGIARDQAGAIDKLDDRVRRARRGFLDHYVSRQISLLGSDVQIVRAPDGLDLDLVREAAVERAIRRLWLELQARNVRPDDWAEWVRAAATRGLLLPAILSYLQFSPPPPKRNLAAIDAINGALLQAIRARTAALEAELARRAAFSPPIVEGGIAALASVGSASVTNASSTR